MMAGGGDAAMRECLHNFAIEDAVWKVGLLEYLRVKGLVDMDEFNTFLSKHRPTYRAMMDQKMKESQDEAYKKWADENPDKVKLLKLFGGFGKPTL